MKIIVSERTKVRLTPDELNQLKQYVVDEPTAYSNITRSTGIHRITVVATIERGWLQKRAAIKLRDFLRAVKKLSI